MATGKLDLEDLTIDEMLDLKDALENKLTEIAKSETALMTQRLARLQTYLPEDKPSSVPGHKPTKPKSRSRKPTRAASKAKSAPVVTPIETPKPEPKPKAKPTRKTRKPSKVSAKYRDPDSGKTWSGRGMVPVWLRELEKAGRKRAEFEV